jgi:hypothetical protein
LEEVLAGLLVYLFSAFSEPIKVGYRAGQHFLASGLNMFRFRGERSSNVMKGIYLVKVITHKENKQNLFSDTLLIFFLEIFFSATSYPLPRTAFMLTGADLVKFVGNLFGFSVNIYNLTNLTLKIKCNQNNATNTQRNAVLIGKFCRHVM